jgi:hypothetical protein
MIDEVVMDNGGVRYNVRVGDEGKPKPFVTRWFNDLGQAFDFYDGFKRDAVMQANVPIHLGQEPDLITEMEKQALNEVEMDDDNH